MQDFQKIVQRILDAFSIFNLDTLPTNSSTCNFALYGEHEIEALHDQFFPDDDSDVTKSQWNDFKYEMLQLKRKWNEYKK